MSAIKLAAFDVDGTTLRGENICGCIARHIGRSADMDAFERLRSQQEIAAGREFMLEWYAPFKKDDLIGYLSDLHLAPGVIEGFARLRDAGVKIALVSITWDFAVSWLGAKLGVDYTVGTRWNENGSISHFWPQDKSLYLDSLLQELGLGRDTLAAVGDSQGDISMLNFASRSYFVGENFPLELHHAKHWHDAGIEEIVIDMLVLDEQQ